MRPYGRNPYAHYNSASRPFLFRGDLPEGIKPMVRVVAVRCVEPASAARLGDDYPE